MPSKQKEFTVVCNECGNKIIFVHGDSMHKEINIQVFLEYTWTGATVDSVDFDCECGNSVELSPKYKVTHFNNDAT